MLLNQEIKLPLNLVFVSDSNPRKPKETDTDIKELTRSIVAVGQITPALGRPHPKRKDCVELCCGARRLTALKALDRDPTKVVRIKVIVQEMDDKRFTSLLAIENRDRKDLTAVEEAKTFGEVLTACKGDLNAAAAFLNEDRKALARRVAILRLAPATLKWIEKECDWDIRHLELIARYPRPRHMTILKGLPYWALRATPQSVANFLVDEERLLDKAPFDIEDKKLFPKAGACTDCPKRSSQDPDLFEAVSKGRKIEDKCLEPGCFEAKREAHTVKAIKEAAEETGKEVIQVQTEGTCVKDTGEGLQPHQYIKSRKTKETTPAVITNGPQKGKIIHVKIPKPAKGKTPTGKPKATLADRRALLARKRWTEVVKRFREVLIETPYKMVKGGELTVLRLVAIIGTAKEEYWSSGNSAEWKTFLADEMTKIQIMQTIWGDLRKTLSKRLHYNGPITQIGDDKIKECQQVADNIQYDLAPLRKQVKEDLPEPKSWANLNADGTKKAAAPKKKKQKKSKLKPSKK